MLSLTRSHEKWWQKPLAFSDGGYLPAELIVLDHSLSDGEKGAWLNSRGTKTAVVDLVQDEDGRFRTVRAELPDFVQRCLESFYAYPDVNKGVFDLVIWRLDSKVVRFIEVKCPHRDHPTPEQERFAQLARSHVIDTCVVEWEFAGSGGTSSSGS